MSDSLDSTAAHTGQSSEPDCQEQVYQRIKFLKEGYLDELNEMYQKIVTKLQQQHDSLPWLESDKLEKLKLYKMMLERIITFLQVSKSNISPKYKEKLGSYEKQIMNFINVHRPKKTLSSLQCGQLPPPRIDWQEEVYQKIKFLKEGYLEELNKMYQKSVTKLQQHDSLPCLESDKLEKLKLYKMMLERIITFLQVSKSNISPSYKDKLGSYEKQIMNFMNTIRPKKTLSSLQCGQLPPPRIDWQEEVYQKIKCMKESYLPELNEIQQRVATKESKLLRRDSLPQQLKLEKVEKLKVFKMALERIIAFLQVSKSNISPYYKENLASYEKQIIDVINTNRPRKTMPPLQPGQLPPPHMQSLSQSLPLVTNVLSHENQMNSQLQTTNLQGSVATMQQNNMASMQHNTLSGVSIAQQRNNCKRPPRFAVDCDEGRRETERRKKIKREIDM